MLRVLLATILGFAATVAAAEVIDLEGTVKAIDVSARTITIERKTPKGTKTLELEVTKKAGDLSSVKTGDSISFSYDPDLELVTKLESGDAGEANKTNEVCRVTFSISETGDCRLRLEKSAPSTGVTERTKQPNGTWTFRHYFSSPSDRSYLIARSAQL
jgi:Cu/Ag efflux protein CusF